jgi:hypothetical protein
VSQPLLVRRGEGCELIIGFQHLVRRGPRIDWIEVSGNRLWLDAAAVVDAKVEHDPIQPRCKARTSRIELTRLRPGSDQGLLGYVFGD